MNYLVTFILALLISVLFTPIYRSLAIRLQILDHPSSEIKTHRHPVPYLGGLAIITAVILTLVGLRMGTHFPTGTLRSLRGILIGTVAMGLLGLVDDIKPGGLGFKVKFLWQILAALVVINYDIRLKFISPLYFSDILTLIWIIGITNAFNIIDIMDGLSSGIAAVAALSFFFISLPGEEIYVNFTGIILAAACIGFIPYNLSTRYKIFMGDTGSLTIGFLLAVVSLGTSYTRINEIGLYAPILILAVPMFDTFFVSYVRIRGNKSPFLGSKDHFALRLITSGLSKKKILSLTYFVTGLLGFAAWSVTQLNFYFACSVYFCVLVLFVIFARLLRRIKMD